MTAMRPGHPATQQPKVQYGCNEPAYKQCAVVERMFCRLKGGRRIRTPFDRDISQLHGCNRLAAAVIWWL
jgi:transposase